MCISLTGHLQQGMIKRRRAHILHTWKVCEISSEGRKKPIAPTPANCPQMLMGLILGGFALDLFPTSWLWCMVGLCDDGGRACPLLPWWYHLRAGTTCVLAYRCLCPPLMSWEILPHPLRITLKSVDLIFFGFDLSLWEVSFQSKQNKKPKPHCQMLRC